MINHNPIKSMRTTAEQFKLCMMISVLFHKWWRKSSLYLTRPKRTMWSNWNNYQTSSKHLEELSRLCFFSNEQGQLESLYKPYRGNYSDAHKVRIICDDPSGYEQQEPYHASLILFLLGLKIHVTTYNKVLDMICI